jgi:hypothetical protein
MSWIIILLLAIIAVGVLLQSEAGKKILTYLSWTIVICGLIYLFYWSAFLVFSFFRGDGLNKVGIIIDRIKIISTPILGVLIIFGVSSKYRTDKVEKNS